MVLFHLHYEALTDWLHFHPQWGGVIAFFIAFSESIPVVGSIIPGSVTMTAVGILIGSRILPLWTTLLWAVAGAFIGDTLGYGIGYYFKDSIKRIWPFSRYPNLLIRGQAFIQRHGGKSVFLGRFIGLVRAIIPIITGMLSMKPRNYFLASIPAAFLWAPFYMLPGMLIGAVSLQLPPEIATELVVSLLIGLFAIWILIKLIHIIYQKTHNYFEQMINNQWTYWCQNPSMRWICYLFRYEEQGEKGQISMVLISLFSLLGFGFIFISVIYHSSYLMHLNVMIYHLFRGSRISLLDPIMIGITTLGDYKVIASVCIILTVFLIVLRHYWAAIHLFFVTFITAEIGWVFKKIFFSPRPLGIFHVDTTNSFPSSHVLLSITFYGFIAFLLTTHLNKSIRSRIYTIVSIVLLAIGVSRLYLSVHWLTDVVAGMFLGIGLLALSFISYRRYSVKPLTSKVILWVSLSSILIAFSFVFYYQLPIELRNSRLIWKEYNISDGMWWDHHTTLLPLYRIDRLGNPKELLNLQWAGLLPDIKNVLEKKGWNALYSKQRDKIEPKDTKLSEVIHYRTLLPRLYNDEKPALEMIKFIERNKSPLILRLWPSHIYLPDKQLPLWVGTIYYQKINKRLVFVRRKLYLPSSEVVYHILRSDIDSKKWISKIYSPSISTKTFGAQYKSSYNVAILLIKPREIS